MASRGARHFEGSQTNTTLPLSPANRLTPSPHLSPQSQHPQPRRPDRPLLTGCPAPVRGRRRRRPRRQVAAGGAQHRAAGGGVGQHGVDQRRPWAAGAGDRARPAHSWWVFDELTCRDFEPCSPCTLPLAASNDTDTLVNNSNVLICSSSSRLINQHNLIHQPPNPGETAAIGSVAPASLLGPEATGPGSRTQDELVSQIFTPPQVRREVHDSGKFTATLQSQPPCCIT